MTDEELKELVASLAISQKETDRQLLETGRQLKETDLQLKQTDRQQKETDRQLNDFRRTQAEANQELRKQLGGLGNKFGDFAEGMAIPSLIDILAKRFGADRIVESRRVHKGQEEMELDLIGTSNGPNPTVVVAEVKSTLNQRELDKFIRNLGRFFEFFPQFRGYKLYGVLAAVDSSKEMETATLAAGICLARMHEDIFRLAVDPHFRPKDFSGLSGAN